jgi:hypothetical protein
MNLLGAAQTEFSNRRRRPCLQVIGRLTLEGPKQDFLIVYDYGSGGLWGVMRARSAEEILARYPELSVESERPDWMTDALMADIKRVETHDIDDEPQGLLKALLADRRP